MSRKMAVKNKSDKSKDAIFSLPNISGATRLSFKRILKMTLFLGFSVVCIFSFQSIKNTIFEQWKVTEISINNNLKQVDPRSIAKILKKDEYAYLLKIDVTKLQEEIKKLNWVKQVEIRKIWPNTIEVLVDEFLPIARINERLLVSSGKLIRANALLNMDELPQLNFENEGSKAEKINANYVEVVERYQMIKKSLTSIGIVVESLDINESLAWTIKTSSGLEIKIGRKQQMKRIERLTNTLHFIDNFDQVKTIDLRYNNGFAISRNEVIKELAG